MEQLKYWKGSAGKINITTVPSDFRIAICADESRARRIVAAVNACEGIETEILEALPLNFKQHAIEFSRLQLENARLLEALKRLIYYHENEEKARSEYLDFSLFAARAALAEAETNAPAQKPTYGTGPMIQERPRPEEPKMPDYNTND